MSEQSNRQLRAGIVALVTAPVAALGVWYAFLWCLVLMGERPAVAALLATPLTSTVVVYGVSLVVGAWALRSLHHGGWLSKSPLWPWGAAILAVGVVALFQPLPISAMLVAAIAIAVVAGQACSQVLLRRRSGPSNGHEV